MADTTTLRRSPLAHLADRMRAAAVTGPRAVALHEWPFVAMVSIRVQPGSEAAIRLEAVLGGPLPTACGEVTEAGSYAAVWLGPDEWLVLAHEDPDPLTARLREALADDHGSVVDVSANRTVLELSGPSARAVLEKGCPVDLHPRAFGPGRAVSTTLARIPVLLWQIGPASYRILPRSSFADYVARWLLDAMQEFDADFPRPGAR